MRFLNVLGSGITIQGTSCHGLMHKDLDPLSGSLTFYGNLGMAGRVISSCFTFLKIQINWEMTAASYIGARNSALEMGISVFVHSWQSCKSQGPSAI